jgi:general secretion pathway protein H
MAPAILRNASRGFTLLELLVVVAIIAFASAGVAFAVRDSGSEALDREGQRLAAMLESARAQSRASGVAVVWRPATGGFRFEGLPVPSPVIAWLNAGTSATASAGNAAFAVNPVNAVVLGPEPLIGPQQITLRSAALPDKSLRLATDGLRPFAIADTPAP